MQKNIGRLEEESNINKSLSTGDVAEAQSISEVKGQGPALAA